MPRPPQNRSLSRSRRRLFIGIALLFAVGIAELTAFAALHWLDAGFSLQAMRARQLLLAAGIGVSPASSNAIHPYLGWTNDPDQSPPTAALGRTVVPNRFGFLYDDGPLPVEHPDRLIIAVAGGSVAWQFLLTCDDYLRRAICSRPEFRGLKIEFFCLANSGYKQPQQLLAVNYFAALGAHFDIVLNIDGYNELALGVHDNFNNETSIAYPGGWHVRSLDIVDPSRALLQKKILETRAARQQAAHSISKSPLRFSFLRNFLWFSTDRNLNARLLRLAEETLLSKQRRFRSHGPNNTAQTEEEAVEETLNQWIRASRQIQRSSGPTSYIHVLQPNQYLSDSKPLSNKERLLISNADSFEAERGELIRKYYPQLQAHGLGLKQSGINFIDLTLLFEDITETVYQDACCHLNIPGYQRIADAILPQIISACRARLKKHR